MFVSASTDCLPDLSLPAALDRLSGLEYTGVELAMFEDREQFKPSFIAANFDKAVEQCRNTERLDIIAFDVRIAATGEAHYEQFLAICRLAKTVKVVTLTIPSAEVGTPFNEEVDHLRRLVDIATQQGVRVGMKSQIGRLSEDMDTVTVLCDNVKGLGLTLDPSVYIYGNAQGKAIDKLMKYTFHTQLRDTNKKGFQVRVGQGDVEYGKLISQLQKVKYNYGLSVYITEVEGVDHAGELRKLRLLLESLL
ncbi:Xylose isomerase-like TIM barrel [Anatilimnocola aggregata]|uniref:Xylose isomerase-like TIM barrel n=1 Tax=Anatilimnocola aggregata TaxID=2528021 RepID=A0A517YKW8_9BACT|nr:Xylose isomerase-like TIM barrel [Anatilimnocola aggregata]